MIKRLEQAIAEARKLPPNKQEAIAETILEQVKREPPSLLEENASLPKQQRTLGGWEGQVWMADDFDAIPDEIAIAFGITEK